jgi:hypothetical protein
VESIRAVRGKNESEARKEEEESQNSCRYANSDEVRNKELERTAARKVRRSFESLLLSIIYVLVYFGFESVHFILFFPFNGGSYLVCFFKKQ